MSLTGDTVIQYAENLICILKCSVNFTNALKRNKFLRKLEDMKNHTITGSSENPTAMKSALVTDISKMNSSPRAS